jgi:hypothetical protein
MKNNQDRPSEHREENQNVIKNNPSDRKPDPEEQNDTGYAGTTQSLSEGEHNDQYEIAIEDTMIGYDGDDSDMDTDIGDGNIDSENRHGVDDND